jgi:NADPH:quinone reductase-like Zn-dependent oxidoreductase
VEILGEAGGADVILDNMGAKYLGRNVDALATQGRLVIIGMQGGAKGELNIGKLLSKRGAVIATALRSRPVPEKTAICQGVVEHVWPLYAEDKIRTLVHERIPLEEAARAHKLMDEGSHSGKILLQVS